jgi:5-methylcytosine-specific restriction endonuclease McrA
MTRTHASQLGLWPDPTFQPTKPPRRFSSEYLAYMGSNAWACRRRTVVANSGGICADCGSQVRLDVHHLTYARLGREHDSDLVAVCRRCHNARHGQ